MDDWESGRQGLVRAGGLGRSNAAIFTAAWDGCVGPANHNTGSGVAPTFEGTRVSNRCPARSKVWPLSVGTTLSILACLPFAVQDEFARRDNSDEGRAACLDLSRVEKIPPDDPVQEKFRELCARLTLLKNPLVEDYRRVYRCTVVASIEDARPGETAQEALLRVDREIEAALGAKEGKRLLSSNSSELIGSWVEVYDWGFTLLLAASKRDELVPIYRVGELQNVLRPIRTPGQALELAALSGLQPRQCDDIKLTKTNEGFVIEGLRTREEWCPSGYARTVKVSRTGSLWILKREGSSSYQACADS